MKNGERGPRGERIRAIAWLLALVLLTLLAVTVAIAEPKFPALTGRIVDEAGLLSADDKRALEQELKALEEKSTDQLVVYTTRSLQGYAIEDFGYQLGRTWAIGQKGKNNGVILIIAPNDRKVRIEVGRGLEPQLTDLMSKLIVENAILPAFRRNDFSGGIKAGVRDIRDVLLGDAQAVKDRARTAKPRSPSPSSSVLPVAILFFIIVVAVVMVWMQSAQMAHPGSALASRNRRRNQTSPWASSSWGSSSSSWSSGSSSSDSGGGFSGGGGDFGGGGSSGSW